MTAPAPTPPSVVFDQAVAGLSSVRPRPEIVLGELAAPTRLAPFSHAMSAAVHGVDGIEVGSGRLVLLHDPAGVEAWNGDLRIVVFATCELDPEVARDPLLPQVAWSWLEEELSDTDYGSLGGTVTATMSTRFGDILGPQHADDLEIRASWTPGSVDTGPHLQAFLQVLAVAAGLPPEGVSPIRVIRQPNA